MEKIVMQKVVNMPVLHLLCLVLIIGQNGIFTQILGIFMLTSGATSRFVLLMSTGNDLPITAHNANRQTFSRERNVLNGWLRIKRPTEEKN